MRVLLAIVTGSIIDAGIFWLFARANGVPVPAAWNLKALLRYPTGSITATLAFAGFTYVMCLAVIFTFARRKPG